MTPSRLLLVEDDSLVAKALRLQLEELGYQVLAETDRGEVALELVQRERPDLVLMDIVLAGKLDGIETARILNRDHIPVIFLTAHDDRHLIERARLAEPYGYILKPCDMRELDATVSIALYRAEAQRWRQKQIELATTLSSLSDALLVTDGQLILTQANQAAERLLQRPAAHLAGSPVTEALSLQGIPPEELQRRLQQSLAYPAPACQELDSQLIRPDGSQVPLGLRISPLGAESGPSQGVVILLLDLTERRRQELETRLHAQVFESSQDGILITDARTRILRVNSALCRQTGYAAEALIGRTPRRLNSKLQDPLFFRPLWSALQQHGHWQGEVWCRRRNGDEYPALLHINALRTPTEAISHYVVVYTDLSATTMMQEQVYRIAHYDPQTQLPNRLLFQRQAQVLLHRAADQQLRLELLVLDLCRFGALNESLGHLAGDRLLKLVAKRLQATLRSHHLLARIGSDSFALLIEPRASLPGGQSAASAVLQCFEAPFDLDGETVPLQANVGVAVYPDDSQEIEVLLRKAHTACSHVTGGRGGHRYYTQEMRLALLAQRQWERELREAIGQQQLCLHYQPQVDLRDGRVIGAEALVRWQHPRKGLTLPALFLPHAEACGLMAGLGHWVLEHACRQLRRWLDQGVALPRLSVNVSASQFQDPGFITGLERAIRRHRVPPGHLCLELVEHTALSPSPEVKVQFQQISRLGVKLALDDFGTGYASLLCLRDHPFDTIKIDRNFMVSSLDSQEDQALLESIIDMGRKLGLTIIAEGVETDEQLHFLFVRACYAIQGFYYSAALPAHLFERLYHQGFAHRRMLPADLYREGPE